MAHLLIMSPKSLHHPSMKERARAAYSGKVHDMKNVHTPPETIMDILIKNTYALQSMFDQPYLIPYMQLPHQIVNWTRAYRQDPQGLVAKRLSDKIDERITEIFKINRNFSLALSDLKDRLKQEMDRYPHSHIESSHQSAHYM